MSDNVANDLAAECWAHGIRFFRLDFKTMRYCCPVKACEAFISPEVVDPIHSVRS